MARKFLTPIDMTKLEIRQLLLEILAGDPPSPVAGQVWYDSTTQRIGLRGATATYKLVRDGGDLSAGTVANTALATNPLARANHTGTQTSSTISDLATTVQAYRLDQFAAPTTAVSLNSQKITGLADPTVDTDAANKKYVDNAVAGLSWKDEVVVATTTSGTFATSFAAGQTVDGVTLAAGNRILIKNQGTADNGIYVVNATGAPTRATDSDTAAEVVGTAVFVASGTTNGGTRWVCNNTGTITLGSTVLTFVQFSAGGTYTAGNGLTLTANDFNVGAGTGISVGADAVSIDTTVTARWKTGLIGNGSSTSLSFNHALGNQFVLAQVYEASTNSLVDCDITQTDTNNVTLTFVSAPAANSMRVVVIG